MSYAPEVGGVYEKTASLPGVPHGPGGLQEPVPELNEKLELDPQAAMFVIELQGLAAGVGQVIVIEPDVAVVFSSSNRK